MFSKPRAHNESTPDHAMCARYKVEIVSCPQGCSLNTKSNTMSCIAPIYIAWTLVGGFFSWSVCVSFVFDSDNSVVEIVVDEMLSPISYKRDD